MKAAVVKSNSNIEIKNIENQSVGPGDILVKMRACGICGSDVEKVFGKYGQPSMRLGHEPAGTIMEVGSKISNFSVGDRVFTHHHVACYSDDCHECNHGNETMCKKYYESNLEPCGLADQYIVPEWNVKHGGVLKIPDSMSFEDAAMIERMLENGQDVEVNLKMEAQNYPDVLSHNVVGEIIGSEFPDQIIVIGGHIDSWDVGQGAMDDAGGCVAAWNVLRILKELNIRPKRTIRLVLWTNEENGLRGANAYRNKYLDQLKNHILAIESDAGVFKPSGFGFTGPDESLKILQDIGTLLKPIQSGVITKGGGGADIGPIMAEGVPGMGLTVESKRYFWYHHTAADTWDKLNIQEFNQCVASMAVMSFVVADMDIRLPK